MSIEECKWISFDAGDLKGISLYTTDSYSKTYDGGNTDSEMMASIQNDNPSGKTIFDIGAYIGASSLVFSRMVGEKGSVIAFEPNPYNLVRTKKNLLKNKGLGDRVQTFTYALSDNNGVVKMHLSKNIDGGHSSTSRINNAHSAIRNEYLPDGFVDIDVNVKKLDDFVKETGIVPDILKVDIEGAEHLLLAGALNTLGRYHPTFYIEIHSEYCAIRCYEILKEYGYKFSILREEEDNRVMVRATVPSSKVAIGSTVEIHESDLKLQNALDSLARLSREVGSSKARLSELDKKLEERRKKITDLNSDLSVVKSELIIKDNELKGLYCSRSWTMTRPLRRLGDLFKNVKNRFTK